MNRPVAEGFIPLPLPEDRFERITLFALRRMAIHGLRDASAVWLMLDGFGPRFLEPLSALRAFMHNLSRSAHRPLRIAPCCAQHMTEDEADVLAILGSAAGDGPSAEHALARLTQNVRVAKPLAAAVRFGEASAGLPARLAT